jgi:hypothetical protein
MLEKELTPEIGLELEFVPDLFELPIEETKRRASSSSSISNH